MANAGNPALALLRPDVRLDDRSEFLLRAETLRALPDLVRAVLFYHLWDPLPDLEASKLPMKALRP